MINLVDANGNYLIYGSKTPNENCGKKGVFFIQYGCQLQEEKGSKQVLGLLFTCTAVFIYFYATVFFDYIRAIESTKQLDFDVKTITAGDYSVEFKIDHAQYDFWKENYFQESNPMSEMAQFKCYVQHTLETRLSEMENLGYEEGDEIKIAQITFAFNNREVINWLKKRGKYIIKHQWEKVDEIQKEIFDHLQKKDPENPENLCQEAQDLLDKLQTPCTCVVTFESEEGYERASQYNENIEFMNQQDPNNKMKKYSNFLNVKDGL